MTMMGTATPIPALAPVDRPEDEAGDGVEVLCEDVAVGRVVDAAERERVELLVGIAVAADRAAESLSESRILRSN